MINAIQQKSLGVNPSSCGYARLRDHLASRERLNGVDQLIWVGMFVGELFLIGDDIYQPSPRHTHFGLGIHQVPEIGRRRAVVWVRIEP